MTRFEARSFGTTEGTNDAIEGKRRATTAELATRWHKQHLEQARSYGSQAESKETDIQDAYNEAYDAARKSMIR